MADVKRLYALGCYYQVVYMNGLNEPAETWVGTSEPLDTECRDVLDKVCQFVQQNIDLDCRSVLFLIERQPEKTRPS